MQRNDVSHTKIHDLSAFVSYLDIMQIPYKILSPYPTLYPQKGPTCGFVAAATAINYWYKTNPDRFPVYPAKKRDWLYYSGRSLRYFSKLSNPGSLNIGAIYNMHEFDPILKPAGYRAKVATFESLQDFEYLMKDALHNELPIILPVDLDDKTVVTLKAGATSHHVTVLGYIQTPGMPAYAVIASHCELHYLPLEDLYNSCANLITTPSRNYAKRDGEWRRVGMSSKPRQNERMVTYPDVDLSALRNHMAFIYPEELAQEYAPVFLRQDNALHNVRAHRNEADLDQWAASQFSRDNPEQTGQYGSNALFFQRKDYRRTDMQTEMRASSKLSYGS